MQRLTRGQPHRAQQKLLQNAKREDLMNDQAAGELGCAAQSRRIGDPKPRVAPRGTIIAGQAARSSSASDTLPGHSAQMAVATRPRYEQAQFAGVIR